MTPAPVDLGSGVHAAFTTVADGNLAENVGADPGQAARNRAGLAAWFGVPVVFGRQVHGARVRFVDGPAHRPDPAGVDALVTDSTTLGLGVLVADCVPVLLADPRARLVAVAHAGRVGLLAGVLSEVVTMLCERGAVPHRVRAVLGPGAGPCCYEVPAEMARDAVARLPQLAATTSWGTPALDLRAGCRAVLDAAGVGRIALAGGCTIEDQTLFSHRAAQGAGPPGQRPPTRSVGRFAGVVRLLP